MRYIDPELLERVNTWLTPTSAQIEYINNQSDTLTRFVEYDSIGRTKRIVVEEYEEIYEYEDHSLIDRMMITMNQKDTITNNYTYEVIQLDEKQNWTQLKAISNMSLGIYVRKERAIYYRKD